MGAAQFVYSQARDETTCGNYIIPMTTRLETQITSQFSEMWASQTPIQHVSSSSCVSSSFTALWLIFLGDHERQHLLLCNRAFATILLLGPLQQIVTASWTLLFGTRNMLGLNFGILFA